MQRRAFLQLLIGTAVGSVFPTPFLLSADAKIDETAVRRIGMIREVFSTDIGAEQFRAAWEMLYDAKSGLTHFGVDGYFASEIEAIKFREEAIHILFDELQNEGIGWNDLLPLPSIKNMQCRFIESCT